MMKTNLILKMVLLLSVLIFSGCETKTVYLPCKAQEPMRTYHKQCSSENNDTKVGECAVSKFFTLEGDYEILLTRFRSCK